MAKTQYVVLRAAPGPSEGNAGVPSENGGRFSIVGRVEAATSKAAITDVATKLAAEGQALTGEFVAVPARSWAPMPVAAQQELSIKVG